MTWHIFELGQDIAKMIILSKFYDDWTKTVTSGVFTRFFYDLTYWPSFLTRHDPYSNITEILSRWSFWTSLMKIGPKLRPLEGSQGFSMICSTDLVFDPTFPIFELDRDIVKMIILTQFHEDWTKTVASRVFTRLSYDLTYWPRFWPVMTHIRTWPRYFQDNHSEQSLMKIGPKLWPPECSQGFSMIWPSDLVFDPKRSIFKLGWELVHDDHSNQVRWRFDQNCGLKSVHKVFRWFDLLT